MNELALTRKNQIFQLEEVLKDLPQATAQLTHHFAEGVYVRAIYLPKGIALTSKIHRYDCVNIMARGHVRTVTTTQTEEVVEVYKGFAIFSGTPGMKRAMVVLEDTVWITVHPNLDNERDIEKLEARLIATNFEELT